MDERHRTCLSLEGVSINHYLGAITLNVHRSTVVRINPNNESTEALLANVNEATIDLSQRSNETKCDQFSRDVVIAAIKRDIKQLEEAEEELKIKKMRLFNELKFYENE